MQSDKLTAAITALAEAGVPVDVQELLLKDNALGKAIEAALSTYAKPVAEIVSKHGDPEAFGERELIARADIQNFPYGTKLYAEPVKTAPAAAVKALPLAAVERRNVDEVDVTGWGVLEGHAIPFAVARGLAERINLCIHSALSAQAQGASGANRRD